MQPGSTTVVLDAGHGGEDGGATGVSGTSEAALNLEISLRLRDLLRLCGVQVSMIRETDTLSIQTAAARSPRKRSRTSKTAPRWSTRPSSRCCSASIRTFLPRASTTAHRSSTPKRPAARQLAEQLQSNLALGLEPGNRRQCKKSDGVYLMEHIDCTGVLVECGFLSNYEEEQRLLAAGISEKAGRRDRGNAVRLAVRGASE